MREATVERVQTVNPYLVCLAAWAVPGAAHLWFGRRAKGLVFLITLPLMFGIGLSLQGRLFPFEISQPLVALAAIADVGIGVPYFLARSLAAGAGTSWPPLTNTAMPS